MSSKDVISATGKNLWWLSTLKYGWETDDYNRRRGGGRPQNLHRNHTVLQSLAPNRGLMKEWHPTKNKPLNPRELRISFEKEVWWICETGHEWQASIERRLKGDGCPSCIGSDPAAGVQPNGAPEPAFDFSLFDDESLQEDDEAPPPDLGATEMDFRKNKRFSHTTTGLLEDSETGYWIYAIMRNYSQDGMYFEVEKAVKPGTIVKIKLEKALNRFFNKNFIGTVTWCNELYGETGSEYMFGLGVQII